MGWIDFVNEESRSRIHRLRVMTDPDAVRQYVAHRLRAEFDFPLRATLMCAVEDCRTRDGIELDLVPLDLEPEGYELMGPIRARADAPLESGSLLTVDLVLDAPTGDGWTATVDGVTTHVAVTT